jgi:thioredoxin-like negative regulator of GroEL
MKGMNYPKESIEFTDKTFTRAIEIYQLVVVFCLPSMEYTFGNPLPVIDKMAKKYEGKIIFGILNVEEYKKIASHYDATTTPVVLIFKNKRLVGYLKNEISIKNIEDRIKQYF